MSASYAEHLKGVAAFLVRQQSLRVERLSENTGEKSRRKITRMFFHDLKLREGVATKIAGSDGFADKIYKTLKELGSSDEVCVLSTWVEPGDALQSLSSALDKVVGREGGTVISCKAGRLAFWESDDMNLRYVLKVAP